MGCGNSSEGQSKPEVGDFKDKYINVSTLGNGASCQVFLVRKVNTQNKYALKQIQDQDHDMWQLECDLLQRVQHPRILNMEESFMEDGYCYIVTALCTGGELFDAIVDEDDVFTEKKASKLTHDMLLALEHIHKQNVAHRDLKPENFVFTDKKKSELCLIDFGGAKTCPPGKEDRMEEDYSGSYYYFSPEANKCRMGQGKMSVNMWKASDIWSLGVITYLMIVSEPPFFYPKERDTYAAISKGKFSYPKNTKMTDQCKDFINKCLTKDISQRMTAEEALQHPWISGNVASSEAMPADHAEKINKYKLHCQMRAVVGHILAHNLTDKDKDHINNVFKLYDTNGDGRLSAEEIDKMMSNLGQGGSSHSAEVFKTLDFNNDGGVESEEFLAGQALGKVTSDADAINGAFNKLDTDGDGTLDLSEVEKAMHGMDKIAVMAALKGADGNADGRIDAAEWAKLVEGVIKG